MDKANEQLSQDTIDFLTAYKSSSPMVQDTFRYVLFSENRIKEASDEDLTSVHHLLQILFCSLKKEMAVRELPDDTTV